MLERILLVQALEELAPIDQHLELQHQAKTKVKNIDVVELGVHEINTWCAQPCSGAPLFLFYTAKVTELHPLCRACFS